MSISAINWALEQDLPHSSEKFVLVALANYANEYGQCYPSIEKLSLDTCQNRKTIIANLSRLLEAGLIKDTGKRAGRTRSITVYLLMKTKQSQNRDTLEKEAVPFFPEAVPFSDGSSPVFSTSSPKIGTGSVRGGEPSETIKEPTLTLAKSPRQAQSNTSACVNLKAVLGGLVKRPVVKQRELLEALYKRPAGTPWTYLEESLLNELSKRPDFPGELDSLIRFHRKMEPTDRRYFPNSLCRLLEAWSETLDRSKVKHSSEPLSILEQDIRNL